MLKKILFLCGVAISAALLWFAIGTYRGAYPLAEENLRGLAVSLLVAAENMAVRDPSLQLLDTLRPQDLAFLAVVDQDGIYRFHSNPDLVGTTAHDRRYFAMFRSGEAVEGRVTLGTAEKVYEFMSPLHLPGRPLIMHLALHTYRADAVVRKAELNMTVLVSLLLGGWVLSSVIYRYALREEMHQREMARKESLARLGEMGAMLAHEIRNPLGGIKGFAQIIEKRPADERNRGFAGRIVAETLRLETLVTNLLAYSRPGLVTPAVVRLDELIAHAVSLVRSEADEQHVRIATACPEGLQLYGDRDRIGQVLLNLMKNAIQAMTEGGSLGIVASTAGKQLSIVVSDTGGGIDPGELSRIFEPFFTTKAQGTGLGLSLCKKIVEEHGGTIAVESEPGHGTTVSLNFPGQKAA